MTPDLGDQALVSVVIPAYNAAAFIADAVNSALSQTHRAVDLIVIDDGSTDTTADIARAAIGDDRRGRVLSYPNGGLPTARNRGIAVARGAFVAQLDADDAFAPDKLRRQLLAFDEHPNTVAVGCLMRYMSSDGRRLPSEGRFHFVSGQDPRSPEMQEMIRQALLLPFIPSSIVYRTDVLRQVGGCEESLPGTGEDIDLLARVAEHGFVGVVMEPLGDYRVHSASMSTRGNLEYQRLSSFVIARQAARRAGGDLTLAEYDADHPTSFYDRRIGYAASWYRSAGVRVVERRALSAAGYLALSLLARPEHAMLRLRRNARLMLSPWTNERTWSIGAPECGAAVAPSRRLNVGCGHDVRPGWINLDSSPLPGVDVVHDLEAVPLPFDDARFDEIDCRDVLEHVDLVPVLRELHRVLAPSGRLHIRSPHFTCFTAWADPTHRRAFSIATFGFFVADNGLNRDYYFDFSFSRIERSVIEFWKTRHQPWNRLAEKMFNRSPRIQRLYESTALARVFPASNINVTLVR